MDSGIIVEANNQNYLNVAWVVIVDFVVDLIVDLIVHCSLFIVFYFSSITQ